MSTKPVSDPTHSEQHMKRKILYEQNVDLSRDIPQRRSLILVSVIHKAPKTPGLGIDDPLCDGDHQTPSAFR
jgi:hypothetical protein